MQSIQGWKIFSIFLYEFILMITGNEEFHQQFFSVQPLINQVLCNNDRKFQPIFPSCEDDFGQNVSCHTSRESCHLLIFKVPSRHAISTIHYTQTILSKLFHEMDHNISFSQRYPQLKIEYTEDQFHWIRPLVDEFLTPRPWLLINRETYPFYTLPSEYGSFTSLSNHSHEKNSNSFYEIIINNYPREYYTYLRHLASVQYPSNSVCEQVPMLFHRYNPSHPGWASVLSMYTLAIRELPYGINTIYVSRSNRLTDDTSFITAKIDCPKQQNKWECAFLASTNCTIPQFLRNKTIENYIANLPETFYYTTVFTNFTEQAILLDHHDPIYQQLFDHLKKQFQQPFTSTQRILANQLKLSPPPNFHYLTTGNTYRVSAFQRVSYQEILQYAFMLRHNAFYRHYIDSLLTDFYQQHQLLPNTSCIAVHVRRGDRVFYGVNITEYCQRKDANQDFGCGSIPFSAITLADVIQAGITLTGNQTTRFFIATDDPYWLKQELRHLENDLSTYQVYTLSLPESIIKLENHIHNKESYDHYAHVIRYLSGTVSGVYFFSTIRLLQQCTSFVGHFGSGTTALFYRLMCYHHGNHQYYATCPPAYDLRSLHKDRR